MFFIWVTLRKWKIYWIASVYYDIFLQRGGQNQDHIYHEQLHSYSDVIEYDMAQNRFTSRGLWHWQQCVFNDFAGCGAVGL